MNMLGSLDFTRFRDLNTRREPYFGHHHTPGELVNCMSEELGEIAGCISGITGVKGRKAHLTIDDLADELGDLFTYMDLLAASYGIDLADAIRRKFDIVSARVAFLERL